MKPVGRRMKTYFRYVSDIICVCAYTILVNVNHCGVSLSEYIGDQQ